MREVVRDLARRCTVCVVSSRDRSVVQGLMGVDDLVVAGSHGFDIWSPEGGAIEREEGAEFADLLGRITGTLREEVASVRGALVEPKRSSVAVHYRLVEERERSQIKELVDRVLAANPDALKVTPGKMVYEIQPMAGLCCTGWTLLGSIGRTCCRCMSVTASRMRACFERSPGGASAFSWPIRPTPRLPGVGPLRTISCAIPGRWRIS